ncbi:RNB domain-containing ribonuclease [Streptomyces sp. AV19]|uniref:RNB domain-containing ribonuclease n=1 Tax=Streptomyces sp. AV19 TaxID=2793068 RepID=UPI0018FECAA0|nr:RNB domain-containing ribonuclease [Streptomyces sp. AV19]MBH1935248.1 RNB domain-containing ribonuclease [Streptomyces sp. AV19]MDG4532064.1 RNB domain-containing ribonuclease [Streptomyces sp. AV19]
MPRRKIRVTDEERAPLRKALRELRERTHAPSAFPAAAQAEAERAARRRPRLPAYDATRLPLFTLDPPGVRELERALHLARRPGGGYRVHYAVADVAAFVAPGGALDAEAHRRAVTVHYPDVRVPLLPLVLCEDAASLLPDHDRPALLWELDLAADGSVVRADLRRALVRSRARLDHAGAQRAIDTGTAEEPLELLRETGLLRRELERARGGVSLDVPVQEVVHRGDRYLLEYRTPPPTEEWSARLALMTGTAAAELMLASGTGVLRTLPSLPVEGGPLTALRRAARALGVTWPDTMPYPVMLRALAPSHPQHAAFLQCCAGLLRRAGYTVFDRERPTRRPAPADPVHAAVAAPYAHCAAPLRRLADRYALELCLAASAGADAPEWVRSALDGLPGEMAAGAARAEEAEREAAALVDAAVLRDRIGEVFDALVVDVVVSRPTAGTVRLRDPAVSGHIEGDRDGPPLPLGHRLRVRLIEADPGRDEVWFAPA